MSRKICALRSPSTMIRSSFLRERSSNRSPNSITRAWLRLQFPISTSVKTLLFASDPLALWAALPVAVFLAAYAPSAVSFVAGQAAFTVLMTSGFAISLVVPDIRPGFCAGWWRGCWPATADSPRRGAVRRPGSAGPFTSRRAGRAAPGCSCRVPRGRGR